MTRWWRCWTVTAPASRSIITPRFAAWPTPWLPGSRSVRPRRPLACWRAAKSRSRWSPALARLDLVALGTVLGHAGVRLCGHQELTRLDGELGALSPFSVDAAAVVVDHDVARSPRVLCGSGRADRDARDLRAGPGSPVRCQRVARRDASTSAAGRRFVKTGGRSGASTTASKGIATLAGSGRSSGGRRSARGRPAASSALGPAQQGGGEHAQHDRDPRGGVQPRSASVRVAGDHSTYSTTAPLG